MKSLLRRTGWFGACCIVCCIFVSLFGVGRFGSVGAGWQYIAGRRLIVSPSTHIYYLPLDARADEHRFSFTFYNCTTKPITLLGRSSTDCACSMLYDLPAVLGPGESKAVEASVWHSMDASTAVVQIRFLTDCPDSRTLTGTIKLVR